MEFRNSIDKYTEISKKNFKRVLFKIIPISLVALLSIIPVAIMSDQFLFVFLSTTVSVLLSISLGLYIGIRKFKSIYNTVVFKLDDAIFTQNIKNKTISIDLDSPSTVSEDKIGNIFVSQGQNRFIVPYSLDEVETLRDLIANKVTITEYNMATKYLGYIYIAFFIGVMFSKYIISRKFFLFVGSGLVLTTILYIFVNIKTAIKKPISLLTLGIQGIFAYSVAKSIYSYFI